MSRLDFVQIDKMEKLASLFNKDWRDKLKLYQGEWDSKQQGSIPAWKYKKKLDFLIMCYLDRCNIIQEECPQIHITKFYIIDKYIEIETKEEKIRNALIEFEAEEVAANKDKYEEEDAFFRKFIFGKYVKASYQGNDRNVSRSNMPGYGASELQRQLNAAIDPARWGALGQTPVGTASMNQAAPATTNEDDDGEDFLDEDDDEVSPSSNLSLEGLRSLWSAVRRGR